MAPYLDPINQGFADAGAKASGPKLYDLSYVDAREFLEKVQAHDPAPDVVTEEFDVPDGPTSKVKTVIYKRAGVTDALLPAVFYTHGGGWILGSPKTHDRLVRDLVRETGLAFVFIYYTPAPDAQFPVQFEEAYAVIEYIGKHGAEKGLKTDRFGIAGDSVGSHMAIAMCSLAAERSGPKIVYQVLFYPVTDMSRESETFKTYKDGPYLEAATLRWMYDACVPNHDDRIKYLASPLLSTKEQLEAHPPTLVIVAGVDPLQAEGEAYGHALQEAGVPTAIFRADGVIHDFVMLNGPATSPTAIASIELAALKLKKALS